MKKYILIILLVFFVQISYVNAASKIQFGGLQCDKADKETGKQVCKLGFNITGGSVSTINKFTITFMLHNVTMSGDDIEPSDNWYVKKESDLVYTFETSETSFSEGFHTIATIIVYKDLKAQDCYIEFTPQPGYVNRSCTVFNDVYYNKSGQQTTKETYEEVCFPHYCEAVNGNYYGKSGSKVSESVYNEECFPHYCEVVNGHYYGKDGTKKSGKDEYDEECTEKKKYCKVEDVDGTKKYYDKEGNEADKEKYEKECFPHVCVEYGEEFYGPDGTPVEETEFNKKCKAHYCEVVDDTYFDSNGIEVLEDVYKNSCLPHICEVVDETYYDINGDEVSEDAYNAVCKAEELHICSIVENKYYDMEGKEVKKEEYEEDCFIHSCEIINGHYYDLDGTLIDKDTYDKHCTTVPNPPTKYINPIVFGIVLVGGVFILYKYIKKHNKLY